MVETRSLSQDDARQWLRQFVQYLNKAGILSRDDIGRLTRFHSAIDRRIGQLGVLKGYLTLRDVYQVLSEQNDENFLFGLAAIRAGFLSEAQVQELLQLQKNTFLLFIESLMLMGVLTAEKLNETVKGFRESLPVKHSSSAPAADAEQAPSPDSAKAIRLARDDVRSRLKRFRGLVTMPAVIQRVLEMTKDPDCEVARVAEVISSDPILSTQLLRMVNSAASGLHRRITRKGA